MPLARITEIKPNGGFDSQYGYMYSSIVYFDDNGWGSANHKNQNPPYGIGDEMEYTITGEFKGTYKLKITKPGSSFAAPARPQPQGETRILPPKTVQSGPVNGASVGMAMNQTLALLTKELTHDEIIERICTPSFWQSVAEVSSDILRVARHLEQGNLAPSVKERANGVSRPVQGSGRGNVAPARQAPTERQMANLSDEPTEDVPY